MVFCSTGTERLSLVQLGDVEGLQTARFYGRPVQKDICVAVKLSVEEAIQRESAWRQR